VLGLACLSVRHLLDPEVIVLVGAWSRLAASSCLPVIRRGRSRATPFRRPQGREVVESALGDDAWPWALWPWPWTWSARNAARAARSKAAFLPAKLHRAVFVADVEAYGRERHGRR